MIEKLTPKDLRLIAGCIVISLVSLFIVQRYFTAAFPEASIQFDITKEEAKQKAEFFLGNRQWDVSGHKHAAKFVYDNEEKTFLERQLDTKEAGRIFNEINGWRWANRWFKPLQKEEYRVDYSTTGKLAHFEHIIPEDAPGDTLRYGIALEIAQFYLTGILEWSPDAWELIDSKTEKRENRLDLTFTWKRKNFDIDGGTHRISVRIQGSEVGRYDEWIQVPETWKRDYEKLRSKNELTSIISFVFNFLTIFAIFVTILLRMRKRDVRWKVAFTYGGVIAILIMLFQINEIPLLKFDFQTTDSYLVFLLRSIFIDVILLPLINAFFISLLIAGAETIYRDHYPHQIAFRNLLSAPGLKTRSFFTSATVGIVLTFFFMAFQTVFYLISKRFDGWSPTEVPDINRLGTVFPWVAVLLGGLLPALSEESISRMFSIPFLQKYTKSTFFAVIVSALIWGSGHSGYAAQPFYIRVIEVSLAGIVIGFIFLRFGILATLIWHFSVDAVYSALILFRSDNPYFFTTAIVCSGLVCIPLIYSIISYFRLGGFLKADSLVNELDTEIAPVKEKEAESLEKAKIEVVYQPLSMERKKLGIALAVVGLILWLIPFKNELEGLVQVNITRLQALEIARKYLDRLHIDLNGYRWVVSQTENLGKRITKEKNAEEGEYKAKVQIVVMGSSDESGSYIVPHYLAQEGDKEAIKRAYTKHLVPTEWRVRFFKPLEKKEYNIYLDTRNGNISGHEFLIADTTYLPSISKDSAQVLVKSFLTERGFGLNDFTMVENEVIEKEKRTDHKLKFQSENAHPGNVGKSHLLYNTTIQGNYVGSFNKGIKLPEDWVREYKKTTPLSFLLKTFILVIGFGLGLLWIITLAKLLKHNRPRWKLVIFGGLGLAALATIEKFNHLTTFFLEYSTSVSEQNYIMQQILWEFFLPFASWWFGYVLWLLSFDLMYPDAFHAFAKTNRKTYVSDALLSAFVSMGLFLSLDFIKRVFQVLLPFWVPASTFDVPEFWGYLPGLDILTGLIDSTIDFFVIVIILQFIYRRYLAHKRFGIWIMALPLFVVFALSGDIHSTPNAIAVGLQNSIRFGLVLYLLRYFWRGNPLSYLFGALMLGPITHVIRFFKLSPSEYQLQGWIVLLVILIPFIFFSIEVFQAKKQKVVF